MRGQSPGYGSGSGSRHSVAYTYTTNPCDYYFLTPITPRDRALDKWHSGTQTFAALVEILVTWAQRSKCPNVGCWAKLCVLL
jgi:hypothetical protein